MVELVRTMTQRIEFPAMRSDVRDALVSLSDRAHQDSVWGRYDPEDGKFDDLTLCVNILYDCHVLPDPGNAVGAVLVPDEVTVFGVLGQELLPMIEHLGTAPDSVYLADPKWPAVVTAARSALETMDAQPR